MEFIKNNPPREFTVGAYQPITIKDCGQVNLLPNEQVSFTTDLGKEHDFVRKEWGFYATPSVNGRLKHQGFKTALVINSFGKIYIMVVEAEKMALFNAYITNTQQEVLEWLDERSLHGDN